MFEARQAACGLRERQAMAPAELGELRAVLKHVEGRRRGGCRGRRRPICSSVRSWRMKVAEQGVGVAGLFAGR